MGRLYKAVKQNPLLNLKPFQTDNGDRGEKFSPLSGPHATAEAIAAQIGVSYRTVQNAAKFTDAVETLQQVSPQAAERVLRGEVRDALTELPKVPKGSVSVCSEGVRKRSAFHQTDFDGVASGTKGATVEGAGAIGSRRHARRHRRTHGRTRVLRGYTGAQVGRAAR
jgi:hypothetical protein